MKYTRLISAAPILGLAHAQAQTPDASYRCAETSRPVIEPCFEIHGRASYWNGTPSLRIRHIGTNHVFGVRDERGPDALERLLAAGDEYDVFENVVYGEFTTCPYTHRAPGAMQFVCVSQVRVLRLVADRRRL